MTEPESTQFFQFDTEGNMYVFAPDTGCTGPTRLVRPGDELIFNSTYNPSDWAMDNIESIGHEENGCASTCPGGVVAVGREFKLPLMEDDLIELSHKNFSDETMRQIHWVCKMYRDWRLYRQGLGLEHIPCDLEDKATITGESLKFTLCRFITKVKKVNGNDFPGKTLYHIIVCIQFHLECLGFAFKLINDPAFMDLKYTLDNTMKACTAQGIGMSIQKAEVLSATDEDLLWSLGFLGQNSPEQLLNTVIFSVRKGFALHAGKEHRALRGLPFKSQLSFMRDPDGEVFLRYMEDIGLKTNKGGLKHRRVDVKTVDLYASQNPERCPPERCPLCAIIKYLSLLPKNRTCSAFYLQPRKKYFGKAWYLNRPAGVNKLRNSVRDMCHQAGLPGHYTNHSLCSTAATKLYPNGLVNSLLWRSQATDPLPYTRTKEPLIGRGNWLVSASLRTERGTPPDYINRSLCIIFVLTLKAIVLSLMAYYVL